MVLRRVELRLELGSLSLSRLCCALLLFLLICQLLLLSKGSGIETII